MYPGSEFFKIPYGTTSFEAADNKRIYKECEAARSKRTSLLETFPWTHDPERKNLCDDC
jgi:hypothetical protein